VTLAPMPTGGHGFGAATVGSNLYIISGAKGRGSDQPTNETLVFNLPQ
jgi:hypothetical protein